MSAEEMPKHYDFGSKEDETYRRWLEAGAFRATPDERDERYVIMMPLPNITGALHMGHAMDNVMQDLIIRWHRMRGANALWQPGTDHAGIATQSVVEKRLIELEGKTRHDIGRDALVERIFQWKDQFQARIVEQQQTMGCSCDWDRQRFTMDPVCARAVRECFFRLFQDRLIYQGERLVNWDCHIQTAVANDEVYSEDVQGHFWHLRYPVIDPKPGEPEHVTVATTRPETMLGDTAVACHPEPRKALEKALSQARTKMAEAKAKDKEAAADEVARLEARMTEVLPGLELLRDMAREGRQVMLPLQERPIPLICDEWAKPELGSGCVKITPAHDPNDYDVWSRHQDEIDRINILQPDGTLNDAAGAYAGLDRYAARDKVVADLDAAGLLAAVEDRVIPIGHSDRSKTPVEPYLSKQWFVRMADVEGGLTMGKGTAKEHSNTGLAQAGIDAVKGEWKSPTGLKLEFFPTGDRYANKYLSWLEEKRDWCISRQLWWGHQIPIWSNEALPAEQVKALAEACRQAHGEDLWLWFDPEGRPAFGIEEAADWSGEGTLTAHVCLRSEDAEAKHAALLEEYALVQDPDVLDTWFSSALWPFSTLGWPDPETAAIEDGQTFLGKGDNPRDSLEMYYPGSCLVTGRDIITLWVARMVIMGLYLLGDLPFFHSFIHATILDGKGEKMSKSKGNGIDPVDIVERYGADSLRYVLCEMQSGTQDIRIPVQADSPFTGNPIELGDAEHGRTMFTYLCPETGKEFDVLGTMDDLPQAQVYSNRFEVGKAFCTKLWNAARFAFMTLGEHEFEPVDLDRLEPEDRWILSRLDRCIEAVDAGLAVYNPSQAVGAAREFFWGDLCDWYLELIKPRMKDEARAPLARTVLAYVLDQVLRLLHPFVPYITEELWKSLGELCPTRGLDAALPTSDLAILAAWPEGRADLRDETLEARFEKMQDVVRGIRDLRARYQVSPNVVADGAVRATGESLEALKLLWSHVRSQGGLGEVELGEAPEKPKLPAKAVVGDVVVFLDGMVDPVKERSRLEGQEEKLSKQIGGLEGRLNNPKFTARAPAEVVEKARGELDEAKGQLTAVQQGLADLEAAGF